MNTWIQIGVVVISSTAFSTLIAYFTSKHLRKAQVKKTEAEATEIYGKAYANLIKDLHTQIKNLKSINEDLGNSKQRLVDDIQELENEVDQLRKTVVKLTNRLKKYESDEQRKEEKKV